MSAAEFWHGEPGLAVQYRRAEEVRWQRRQQELWTAGRYTQLAVASALSQEVRYPSEPFPVTRQEAEAQRKRQEEAETRRQQAAMAAWVRQFKRQKEASHEHRD